MLVRVEQHVRERVAGLARRLQHVRVVAIGEHGAFAGLLRIDRSREANLQALEPAAER